MNKFVVIAPMFNASSTLMRMLCSLYGQSYDNWSLILIDDVSSSEHVSECKRILDVFANLGGQITCIWNVEKRWEVANVLHGISFCEDSDIVCRIDADDALCDLDAFAIMNSAYEQTQCVAAWSAHRWALSDKNISNNLPSKANPYTHPWVSSHLKTFRKQLLNNVPYENFTNMNGDLVKRCGDQAVMLPVLHNAKGKHVFVPRALYSYTIDDAPATYQTADAKFQKEEAEFIRKRGYVSSGQAWESIIKL